MSANETLELLSKQWCSLQDLMKLTNLGRNSALKIRKEIITDLEDKGYSIRVVSMPSTELFDNQSKEYQFKVLGDRYEKRVFIEMSTTYGLHKYAKNVIGIDEFGLSAKADDVINNFGFTARKIAKEVENLML